MVQVYARPYCQRHHAGIISEATAFLALGHLATIIMTMVVVIGSGGIWKQLDMKTEQPLATPSAEVFTILEGRTAGQMVMWSTSPILNAVQSELLAAVNYQVANIDNNEDGKPDAIRVKALVRTAIPVHNVKLILQLHYTLKASTKLSMYSLAFLQHSSAVEGSKMIATGELKLQQRNPLTRFGRTVYDRVLDFSGRNATTDPFPEEVLFNLPAILQGYLARNESTSLTSSDVWWQAGSLGKFELDLTIKIPTHQVVLYRPQVVEELKYGWVQFIAVYWIFWAVFRGFQWLIFHCRVVDTRIVSDFQRKPQHF